MAKSLAHGDYRLLMAFESASSEGSWYRVLQDKSNEVLSCDCPRWLHKRQGAERSCKHTETVARLLATQNAPAERPGAADTPHTQSLVSAAREQWQGLEGTWGIEERDALVGDTKYRFVLLRLDTPTNLSGTGVVAFAHRHGVSTARLIPGVTGWAGYALAAQIAQQAGFAMVGQPPEHFKWQASARTTTTRIGLRDILRVADRTDLGDGLTPAQRAENTLQLFLGDLYTTLETQGYLDVPSRLYQGQQRVYRLRRDPHKQRARRIRMFEHGRYINDLCVVPREAVPEADHLLTVFLQLMTDESTVLRVVQQYNIFPPNSDGTERETVAPQWQAA